MSGANVVPMRAAGGSYLATVTLYRMPDGLIRAEVVDMPAHVIEDRAHISARFIDLSSWTASATADFLRQAVAFEDDPEGLAAS